MRSSANNGESVSLRLAEFGEGRDARAANWETPVRTRPSHRNSMGNEKDDCNHTVRSQIADCGSGASADLGLRPKQVGPTLDIEASPPQSTKVSPTDVPH